MDISALEKALEREKAARKAINSRIRNLNRQLSAARAQAETDRKAALADALLKKIGVDAPATDADIDDLAAAMAESITAAPIDPSHVSEPADTLGAQYETNDGHYDD